jgi:RNA polymerase sigma factor (sigma-70 family)
MAPARRAAVSHSAARGYGPSNLPPQRERAIVRAAARNEADARTVLVEAFWPGIASVARIYRGSPAVTRDELMQEGVVGLLRALERFDYEHGTPFWAYASWWVRQAMQQLVAEMTGPVVLSDRALRRLARIKSVRREHVQEHGREPSITELASEAGLTRVQVEALQAAEHTPRGLEEPRRDDDSSGSLGDRLVDPVAEDEYARVEDMIEVEEMRDLPDELGGRERDVVRAHFGLDRPPQTLREIAGGLGLSVERVRQIEQRALGRMREAASA